MSPEVALITAIATLLIVVVAVSIVAGIAIAIFVLKAIVEENKNPL